MSYLDDFKSAVRVRRVVARFLKAKEFPTEEALKQYLQKHPGADKSKHRVVDHDLQRVKKDVADWNKLKKVQDQEDRRQDRKDKGETTKKLRKFKKNHPEGSINWDYSPGSK